MHIPVWIITPITDAHELGKAFRKAEELAGMFSEGNFKMDDRNEGLMPPLRNDWRKTGGRWNEEVDPGPGNNWAFGKDAASRPDHMMPRAVITPEGVRRVAKRAGRDRGDPEDAASLARQHRDRPGLALLTEEWTRAGPGTPAGSGIRNMETGWKAARRARRPHTRRKLKERPPTTRAGRKRRRAMKDISSALRMKGLLP